MVIFILFYFFIALGYYNKSFRSHTNVSEKIITAHNIVPAHSPFNIQKQMNPVTVIIHHH